jgi:L-seryl-tRNA(Ser) seleniumtransferase
LRLHLDWHRVAERVPVWRMLTCPLPKLRDRADKLRERLAPLTAWQVLEVRDSNAETGSGTLPAVSIPSVALCAIPQGWSAAKWAQRLRVADVPVVGSVRDDVLWLDLRTLSEEDEDDLVRSVDRVLRDKP